MSHSFDPRSGCASDRSRRTRAEMSPIEHVDLRAITTGPLKCERVARTRDSGCGATVHVGDHSILTYVYRDGYLSSI